MTSKPEIILLLSDARGVYIPRDFARCIKRDAVTNVSAEDWEALECGPTPENESYWDTWDAVCNNAVITDEGGQNWFVHQDGDCWLIPEGMEWSDETATFEWPADDEA